MLAMLSRCMAEIAPLLHAAKHVAIEGYIGITHKDYWVSHPGLTALAFLST
jgi:hypothetical protein